jgi:lipopolysaccharide export system protein LptA
MRYSFFGIMGTSFAVTAAIIGFAAPAQVIKNHNSKAPVNFSAGAIELQDRADRVILTGGVTATQAGLSMSASRVTAAYTSSGGIDVQRMDAVGGVTITKDDLRATSEAAIYDLKSDLITLVGNVQLVQGANRLNGGRIVIDLNSGRSTINGGSAPAPAGTPTTPGVTGNTGGRVTGTFTVPQRKN